MLNTATAKGRNVSIMRNDESLVVAHESDGDAYAECTCGWSVAIRNGRMTDALKAFRSHNSKHAYEGRRTYKDDLASGRERCLRCFAILEDGTALLRGAAKHITYGYMCGCALEVLFEERYN